MVYVPISQHKSKCQHSERRSRKPLGSLSCGEGHGHCVHAAAKGHLREAAGRQQGIKAPSQWLFLLGGFERATCHPAARHLEMEDSSESHQVSAFKSSFSPVVLGNSYSM